MLISKLVKIITSVPIIVLLINCQDLFSSVTWTETVQSTAPAGDVYFSEVLDASTNTAHISHIYWIATSSGPSALTIKLRASENIFNSTDTTPAWETVSLGSDPTSSGRYIQYCASFTYVSTITALNYMYITYYSTAQTETTPTPPGAWAIQSPIDWINNLTPDVTIDISDSGSGLRVKGTGTGENQIDYEYKKDTSSTAGHWHFNETEGPYAVDYSTNSRLGVLGGGNTNYSPVSTDGITGYNQPNKALQFDGQDDYIIINDTLAFDFGINSSFTIECWIKVTPTGSNQRILQKLQGQFGDEDGRGYLFMIDGSGKVSFAIFNPSNSQPVYSSSALNIDEWNHIAAVKDNSNTKLRIYFNGVQEDEINYSTANISNTGNLLIGKSSSGEYLNAVIDELRILNRALTETEIVQDCCSARYQYYTSTGGWSDWKSASPTSISENGDKIARTITAKSVPFNKESSTGTGAGNQIKFCIYDIDGNRGESDGLTTIKIDTTPVADVSSVSALAQITASQIEISWTNPPDVDYENTIIARSTEPIIWSPSGNVSLTKVSQSPDVYVIFKDLSPTTLTDTNLSEKTTHHYKLWTIDQALNYSAGVSTSARTGDFTSPTAIALTVEDKENTENAILLAWTQSSAEDFGGYHIYRATFNFNNTTYSGVICIATITAVTTLTYEDTGVTDGIKYYYAIAVYDNVFNENPNVTNAVVSVIPVDDVPGDISEVFDNTQEQTAVAGDNKTKVIIPAGTINTTYYVIINRTAETTPNVANKQEINSANAEDDIDTDTDRIPGTIVEYNLYISTGVRYTDNFSKSVRIVVPYTDTNQDSIVDGTNVHEDNLFVARLVNSRWQKIITSVPIKDQNVIVADVNSFSVFCILGSVTKTNLLNAHCYPNPYEITKHRGLDITFTDITKNSKIQIFTISGDLVKTIQETDGRGWVKWNLRNESNEEVVSGVYIYLITDTSGNKKSNRLMIIK